MHANSIVLGVLWTENVDPYSAANMQTHFSSCAGVTDIKVDKDISQVAVFGEADLSQVLKKLKNVDKEAQAISVYKQKLQQVSLALAPRLYPLCHASWSIATGHHYHPGRKSSYPGDFSSHVSPMNIYCAYQISSLQHSLYSSTPMCFLGTSSGFIRTLFGRIPDVMPL